MDWEEFQTEFWKDFCPAHLDVAAINRLESTTYYQKNRSLDNYLDKFLDLVMEAGYIDPKMTGKIQERTGSTDPEHCGNHGLPLTIGMKQQKMLTKTAQPTKPSRYLSGHPYLPPSLLV